MPSPLKIAVVGAGSFVFGPSVLIQALVENKINDAELMLIDTDPETLELMAGVGRRMILVNGLKTTISTTTDLAAGLAGADYVVCSAARQLQRRHHRDTEIIARLMPEHRVTEFGGIAGIGYSLRQIALVEEITNHMKRVCPNAWFLTVSNPLPRVCQAAHENGIRTAGFCFVTITAYEMLWAIFNGERIHYPFAEGRERWQATLAGLNHFSWLVDLRERATGEDAMPELRRLVAAGATSGSPRAEALLRETGYLLTPGDGHTQDFLPAIPVEPRAHSHDPWHGDLAERQRRLGMLAAISRGEESWDKIDVIAWERPIDFIVALNGGPVAHPHAVNLINEGQIPNLPRTAFVETACTVDADGPHPQTVVLPESVLPLTLQTAEVTNTIVRAARERSRTLVHRAVDLDPTIADKAIGHIAIDEVLAAHADILPVYS